VSEYEEDDGEGLGDDIWGELSADDFTDELGDEVEMFDEDEDCEGF